MDVSGWIDGWAGQTPDRAALRFEGRAISYAELAADIRALAASLVRAEIGPGDRVAFLGLNSPSCLALLFACARIGAIFMPLNWRLAPPEHEFMLRDCPPKLLFVHPAFRSGVESIRAGIGPVRLVALGDAPEGWTSFDGFTVGASVVTVEPRGDYSSPVLLCYTSGSTGRPKGVVHNQYALLFNAINSSHLHGMTHADNVLTTLPLFHVGGLNNQTLPALHAGATVSLQAKFDPDATFDEIERHRVTLTCLVPAQLDILMASPRWASADFSSLRAISTGSSVIPERITRAVHAKGVPLAQIYGSTETSPIATYVMPHDAMRKPGSAGKPAIHCRVRLVDERGNEVPPGSSGEVTVKGPNVMTGYWNLPQASAAALRDGWFHTGDMGYFDDEGYLYINGRIKEMIISGGENVYPAEIENILSDCPGIAEATVVGQPDERWGEMVVAVVVRKPGAAITEADVIELLQGRIARYKHPRRVVFTEQLPRTALGKVRREDVRALVASVSTPSALAGEGSLTKLAG